MNADRPLFFTHEQPGELRATLLRLAAEGCSVFEWNAAEGMSRLGPHRAIVPGTRAVLSAIGYVASVRQDSLFVFRDMDLPLQSHGMQMAIRGALNLFGARRRMIIPTHHTPVPEGLRDVSLPLAELCMPEEPGMAVVGQ